MRYAIASVFLLAPILAIGQPTVGDNQALLDFLSSYAKQKIKKDEFESTEAYQRRISTYSGKEFVIVVPATKQSIPKPLSYNADTETLTVTLTGNSNFPLAPSKVISPFSPDAQRNRAFFAPLGYAKFFLSKEELRSAGEYRASNAMGATTTVTTQRATERSVGLLNVPDSSSASSSVKVKMPPDAAKALSGRAMWRIHLRTHLISGQTDFVLYDGLYANPTFSNPTDLQIDGRTVTALMVKAELIDPSTDTVIATFTAR